VSVRSDCSLAGAVSVPHAAASRIAAGRHKLLIADQTAPKDSHDREHLRALVPARFQVEKAPCWPRGRYLAVLAPRSQRRLWRSSVTTLEGNSEGYVRARNSYARRNSAPPQSV
jgi:hypothetical protein